MQEKETLDEAPPTPTREEGKKESTKDGKFAFRKMKTPKKEKPDKNSPSRYEGDGVVFKAKLIGVESVEDARGDKMCQDAMTRLKLNVRNTGPHKRKINICVSLQGIKIKDEKNTSVIYHHPVSLISFISQDITDARAFGYVFGSTSEPHQFIAIKTEKPAFHVVLALRDLFQTVLNHKQEEIQNVKETAIEGSKEDSSQAKEITNMATTNATPKVIENIKPKDENIYFEVLLTEPLQMREEPKEPVKTVDDLLDLQSEMSKLQEGIMQMDTSIAAAAAFNTEIPVPEIDPFDTSFVLGPKRDSFTIPMPTPVPVLATVNDTPQLNETLSNDKYAVFNAIDATPSIFQSSEANEAVVTDLKELEEEIVRKTAPPKPPRNAKTDSPDLSLFADLDPLGKDRPYKDKAEFFQDVKNPPKKVLNDLVDPSKEPSKVFDASSVPFPVDFESMSSPPSNSSKYKLSHTLNGNGEKTYNPFENQNGYCSNDAESKVPVMSLGTSPGVHQQLSVNCNMANLTTHYSLQQNTSSPIPIPSKTPGLIKDRSFSNGSIGGSVYSKSPQPYSAESPNNSDYYMSAYNNSEGNSPTGILNGENGISPNLTKQNINSFLNNATNPNTQNGVSRPRPRPNKGGPIPNCGRTVSSHSLSSDSSSDYEQISRENMQSIANVLLTNGHRLRAQSLCIESNNEYKLKMPSEKNIFAKKNDPFADDFFFSVPKKSSHLTSAEIPEYV